jgi:hypothetical protein
VTGVARPFATAGVSLFVGAGFGVNGFEASAGVEGAITLATASAVNSAGAGIRVEPRPDTRPLPPDIAAAAASLAEGVPSAAFPGAGPREYRFGLGYTYGSEVRLDDILRGTIAARVRVKFLFFSKTWRAVLLRFGGLDPVTFPLLSGGNGLPAEDTGPGHAWGTVQMPLPFVQLAMLDESEVLPGPNGTEGFDTTGVEELFYDGLCICSEPGDGCVRTADCCEDPPGLACFDDPLIPGTASTCVPCRADTFSCNEDDDCCAGLTCFSNPANGDQKECSDCRENANVGVTGESCNDVADCCLVPDLGGPRPPRLGCFEQIAGTGKKCTECLASGPCSSSSDCCGSLECVGGTCTVT